MGYDFHGQWHAANPDGTFETLELGRNAELFSLFGLKCSNLDLPPLRQVEAPTALGLQRYPDAPVQGCVTLTDLLAYDS
ncbi:hypothetical protein E5F05_00530 (plasmid) [Deinococcus metallilatus]|uniref:Uncharacterized protein n=1 Tax=Deinococcus metallilatus TaxID=1211322 RepID=A0AAJ5F7T7_9DEIO|nr:hypothetical protein [Deinococcus metallilatus]MBB5293386.1 hypothetical protein [Deinococcus metallilatus]QBY06483.1 hypothetical protein E5F05_00530 [Deinococcus metallilatus]RXJ17826.1 hypothetical protein ERJ73_00140 [Deinococcus metallilatus]TLK32098.1 hypothetical protein FCS05_01160 [Deinococcus metallilatus]GMA15393.1 hypothetical protein GCM10025871_17240 [Deinococcus metallilatus]